MAYAMAVSDSPLKGSSPVPANTIVTAHDHDQRWPADVFTDNERPPFEDPRVQNLRGAEPGDPLRCGDLLQKVAPDLRVRGRRQKLDRRRASGRTLSQEHDALAALPEAAEQPVH